MNGYEVAAVALYEFILPIENSQNVNHGKMQVSKKEKGII